MGDEQFLSQEELDSLLSQIDESQNELTDLEKDMFGEIGNIIMGSGTTALSTLLGRKVDITVPAVEIKKLKEIREEVKGKNAVVSINFKGEIEGLNALVLPQMAVARIANIMMGGDGNVETDEVDEISLSAVSEAMNQMMGAAATSLSDMLKKTVDITPPTVELLDFDEEDVKFPPVVSNDDDIVAKVNFKLEIEGLEPADFFLTMSPPFVKKLYRLLFGEEKKQASPQQQAQPSTPQQAPTTENENIQNVKMSENIQKNPVSVSPVQFQSFESGGIVKSTSEIPERIKALLDIPLNVVVELGKTKLTLKQVMELSVGSLIELDKLTGEPVDIIVNGKLIARGEVVVIDENFGVRITEIVSPQERFYTLE
ncbi:chemotaxis protein CheC [Thermosipho melanesiensis]|nr:flagellar motor switch phosphatase FliY [Thermosipho melanesiensis]APT74238.1 chemotaxis protein CheC [Thermosipho melanesiensis]OOC36792.1 chemotaxis protein CheC [Thermosipho melanesiensis]OOC37329.1 chemotaxis protein CheC [Thermosipho melanesiensis]OOC38081.1 chemotaxis protein CheC [Thermosipho melanesiensis]OOC41310.1 chemotaxis protein CheC [Thermosipho melanesiensis]